MRYVCFTIVLLAALRTVEPVRAQLAVPVKRNYAVLQGVRGNGLRGDYYNGTNFEEKVLSRTDKQVNFYLFRKSPGPGVYAEDYSVRWTGKLLAPVTGTYKIIVHVDDGVRLWLGGKLLINDWNIQEEVVREAGIELKAGHYYKLKLEYYNGPVTTIIKLAWECPKDVVRVLGLPVYTPEEIIPQRYLFSQPVPLLVYQPVPAVVQLAPKATSKITSASLRTSSAQVKKAASTLPEPVPSVTGILPVVIYKPKRATASRLPTNNAPETPIVATPREDTWDSLETDKAMVLENVFFAQSKSVLLPESVPELDRLVKLLQKFSYLYINIAGHTDNLGSYRLKKRLSIKRALVVADYLQQHGIAGNRITTQGYADRRPITGNATETERAKNRRVEFIVSANKME
ncbi:hypothetical protein AHMF7605_14555 [Adhaeribacter arboris]|uniref:Signaling protein n=1 Tax=Adhaeribacter arboris TaxID=2072846 RepID=A0A2T2YGJ5_9BACT|nr:PA14 domain-containing protein [Adhaeribacter arboris]PSR54641.1 hypothetical protein AHMF7605_14555 [Adhaeribacter arboris]